MYKHILILPDGREISSGPGTVNAIQSLTLTQAVNAGPELTLGSCCSNLMEATLLTPGGLDIAAGEKLTLLREAADGTRAKLGIFTVETPARPAPNTLKLTGFDSVAGLDKDLTAWLAACTGWPYGIQEFAQLICLECDLTYISEPDLPNGDLLIGPWMVQGVTGRQIMRWLGEITCRFVYADENGSIRLGWYRDSGKTLAPTGANCYFSLNYEDYTVEPIDRVQLQLGSGEAGAPWPPAAPGENTYVLARNPILAACGTQELEARLRAMGSDLAEVDYTPCTVSAPADPQIRPGSILRVLTPQGKTVTAWVMEKISNGRRDTYRCTGSPRRDSLTALYSRPAGLQAAQAALAGLTQSQIFSILTNQGQDQGLFLQDGKVYLNAQYILSGTFAATGEVFLEPGMEEAETIRLHLLGLSPIPQEALSRYDFNGDGEVGISDMLLARQCALGRHSLQDWSGAEKTPVTVTLEPGNPEKALRIRGTNMWGREVEYYLGFTGTNMGRILGDLILTGSIYLGEGAVVDALPAESQPGRILFLKTDTQAPWAPCQCYIGV